MSRRRHRRHIFRFWVALDDEPGNDPPGARQSRPTDDRRKFRKIVASPRRLAVSWMVSCSSFKVTRAVDWAASKKISRRPVTDACLTHMFRKAPE
jgi:hypothetical protein